MISFILFCVFKLSANVSKIVKVYVCVVALPEMVWEDNAMWEGERGEGGEEFTQPDGQTHGEWREGSSH